MNKPRPKWHAWPRQSGPRTGAVKVGIKRHSGCLRGIELFGFESLSSTMEVAMRVSNWIAALVACIAMAGTAS